MFKMSESKRGFHMVFANGWTVSVQWHDFSYSHARGIKGDVDSPTAEVWAWKDHEKKSSAPIGWQTPEQVCEFMQEISQLS